MTVLGASVRKLYELIADADQIPLTINLTTSLVPIAINVVTDGLRNLVVDSANISHP